MTRSRKGMSFVRHTLGGKGFQPDTPCRHRVVERIRSFRRTHHFVCDQRFVALFPMDGNVLRYTRGGSLPDGGRPLFGHIVSSSSGAFFMGQFKGEMAMKEDRAVSKRRLGAMELLGICGFAFFFGWMLVAFYWLFVIFLQDIPIALRDGIQLFIFIGMTSGYVVLHLVAKRLELSRIAVPLLATETILTLLLPLCALALSFDIALPVPLLCGINLLTGLCGASLTVSWLDVSSRIRLLGLERFTGLSLVGGGVLFCS